MAADELADTVGSARWARQNGLVAEVWPAVPGGLAWGTISACPIFLERLHRDPVEIAHELAAKSRYVRASPHRGLGRALSAQRRDPGARPRRLLFPDLPPDPLESSAP